MGGLPDFVIVVFFSALAVSFLIFLLLRRFMLWYFQIDRRIELLEDIKKAVTGEKEVETWKCPKCNHMVSARHPACIYCGEIIDNSIFAAG